MYMIQHVSKQIVVTIYTLADAYYHAPEVTFNPDSIALGHVPIKKSYDLVHWQFVGWAMDSIPQGIVSHVRSHNQNQGADGIWAPFVVKVGKTYRMYYSVSGFWH